MTTIADFGSVTITAGAGASFIFPEEIDFKAMRDLGKSDAHPVLVVELASPDAGAASRYQLEILHGDATAPTGSLALSGKVLNPNAGVLIEFPIPLMHREFMRAKLITTGAAIAANTAKAYIKHGGHAGHVSAKMPD